MTRAHPWHQHQWRGSWGGWRTLTQFVDGVDVGVAGDELLHHALHRHAGGQDERRGAVVHAGVQVCGTVPDEDL